MVTRGLDYIHERLQIVLVVLERLAHRLTDGLESGEMNDRVDLVGREQQFRGHRVAKIHLHERNVLSSSDFLHTLVAGLVTVGHVVCDNDIVAGLDKLHRDMASDKSGTAGHKNAFFHIQNNLIQVRVARIVYGTLAVRAVRSICAVPSAPCHLRRATHAVRAVLWHQRGSHCLYRQCRPLQIIVTARSRNAGIQTANLTIKTLFLYSCRSRILSCGIGAACKS